MTGTQLYRVLVTRFCTVTTRSQTTTIKSKKKVLRTKTVDCEIKPMRHVFVAKFGGMTWSSSRCIPREKHGIRLVN